MADDVDNAQQAEELYRTTALCHRQVELVADGMCHFCAELLDVGQKFCDADCRDLWEQQARFNR